jgi:hypothetical protein
MPATTLARRASLLDFNAPPWAEIRRPEHGEHEKKTFFLLIAEKHPQRRHQSRPRSAAAAGGAKRRAFTDAGAEGTARQRRRNPAHRDFQRKTTIKADFPS